MAAAKPKVVDQDKIDEDHIFDAVIIGAGWAGLAAATTLKKKGCDNICILEARDYIGGRSITSYELGVPLDLGSSWIHGRSKNHPLQRLIKEFNLPAAKCGGEGNWRNLATYDADGNELTTKQIKQWGKTQRNFMTYMERRQERDAEDTTLEEVLKTYMSIKGIAAGSDEEARLRWMLFSDIVAEYAAPLNELSLKFWDIDEEFGSGDSYLAVDKGGYSTVVKQYAKSVESFVRLKTRVNAVEYPNNTAVTIRCSNTDTGKECAPIKAKKAIVTLPLGILQARSVQFTPELPKAKVDAIDSLGIGLLNKIVLYWEDESDIFWPRDKEWIMQMEKSTPSGPFSVLEFFNPCSLDSSQKILIGFVIADQAKQMEKHSDEEIANVALGTLRGIYGDDKVRSPKKVLVTRWGSDEFSLGSYSYQRIGSRENSRNELARPINDCIYFAGEATDSKFPATTHGALMSGERAGKAVASKLKNTGSLRDKLYSSLSLK